MSWTTEREIKLKELWKKGHTASKIAEILGDTTRNAVIGKAHRLSLQARAASKKPSAKVNAENNIIATRLHIAWNGNLRNVIMYNIKIETIAIDNNKKNTSINLSYITIISFILADAKTITTEKHANITGKKDHR